MASVFISHSARDNVQAERIRQSLKAAGFATVYLDFDPESGIPRGRKWEDELYSELRKADVVVFLSTAASVSSKWCHAELALARALGRPIVPVLLEPGRQGPNLRTPRVAWLDSQPLRVLEERVRRKSRVSSRRAEFAHPTRQSRHLLAPVGCQNSVSPANAVIREGRSESWHLTGADSPASASEACGRPIMRSSPHLRVYFRIGAGVWLPEMACARPAASTSRRMRTDDLP